MGERSAQALPTECVREAGGAKELGAGFVQRAVERLLVVLRITGLSVVLACSADSTRPAGVRRSWVGENRIEANSPSELGVIKCLLLQRDLGDGDRQA